MNNSVLAEMRISWMSLFLIWTIPEKTQTERIEDMEFPGVLKKFKKAVDF